MSAAEASLPTLLCSRPKVSFSGPKKSRRPVPVALEIPDEAAEAPPTVHVKNTFINSASQRSPSLEAFYRERAVRTCPSKHIGRFANIVQDPANGAADAPQATPQGPQASPCGVHTPCDIQTPVGENHISLHALHQLMQSPVPSPFMELTDVYQGYDPHHQALCLPPMCPEHMGMPPHPFLGGPHDMGFGGLPCALPVDQPALCPPSMLPPPPPPRTVLTLADSITPYPVADYRRGSYVDWGVAPTFAGFPPVPPPPPPPMLRPGAGPVVGPMVADGRALPAHCLDSLPQYSAPRFDPDTSSRQLGLDSAVLVPPPPEGFAPGSPELPSSGSAGHAEGRCKPCAFLHTKGCDNGVACQFCHMCGPGEKKRRQREKLEQRRAAHKARQLASDEPQL